MYLGLHIGEVFYGNIGSKERLDFTVIGPAVNEVSRIAAMCRSIDQPLLISAAFAAAVSEPQQPFVSVGRYASARRRPTPGTLHARFSDVTRRPPDSAGAFLIFFRGRVRPVVDLEFPRARFRPRRQLQRCISMVSNLLINNVA